MSPENGTRVEVGRGAVLWALGRFHSRDCSECVCEGWLRLCEGEQEQWVWEVEGGQAVPRERGMRVTEPGGGHGGGNGLLRIDGGESPREQITAKG